MSAEETKPTGAEETASPAEAEIKEDKTAETGKKAPEETETTPASVEEIARERGWKPKDQFTGDPKDYVDADTFVRNQWDITDSYRKSNKSLGRQVEELVIMVRNLQKSQKKTSEAQINQAKAKLEEARQEAIAEGDSETVKKIEKDVQELDKSMKDEESESTEEKLSPAFISWKEKNDWYGTDPRLTRYAEVIAKEFPEGTPIEKILKAIDKEIKEFRTDLDKAKDEDEKKKTKTSVEAGGHSPGQQTRKYTRRDLTEEQRAVVDRFVAKGTMTEQAYIDQLEASGEIKQK